MSEVRWIKITTNMFEDEKIDFIESLPEADSILIIWIKLLTQAGKTNTNGFIYLTEQIPYTTEMLSHKFRRPFNIVKLALETLKRLEMIEFDDEGFLRISNWEKHQNVEGLEKIREQNRIRQARHRAKQKELTEDNKESNVRVTLCNGTEEEEEEEEEEEREEDKEEDKEEEKTSYNNEFKEIAQLYQQIIGQANSLTAEWITTVLKEYGFKWVKSAMMESEKRGKRNKSYIEAILQNWKNDGGMKLGGKADGKNLTGNDGKDEEIDWAERAGVISL